MKIVLFIIILAQITEYARAYHFYRRSDATPPPPPPEVQALIELLHSLEVNYKLSDTALNVTEDEDEKKVLEEVKEKNKKIAEAMFKDQEIDDIIEEVIALFGDFEESWGAWEETHAARKKKRRLMKATRRNDEKVEEINALKEKVENMNSQMEEAGGGGDSKRRSNRRRALAINNTRRSGSKRNGKKSRRHSRRSFRNYAKNLHGYTNKAFSSLRKSLRALMRDIDDNKPRKSKKAKRRTDEGGDGESDATKKVKENVKKEITQFCVELTELAEGLVDSLFKMIEEIDKPGGDEGEEKEEEEEEEKKE